MKPLVPRTYVHAATWHVFISTSGESLALYHSHMTWPDKHILPRVLWCQFVSANISPHYWLQLQWRGEGEQLQLLPKNAEVTLALFNFGCKAVCGLNHSLSCRGYQTEGKVSQRTSLLSLMKVTKSLRNIQKRLLLYPDASKIAVSNLSSLFRFSQ